MKQIILAMLSFYLLLGCTSGTNNVLFSDDFEDHRINEEPLEPWEKSGTGEVRIDSSKSHSGKQSVHFVSGEKYTNRAFLGLYNAPVFPLTNNAYYASMYLWIEEVSPDGIHWTMLQSSGKVLDQSYSSEIRYGGQHHKQLMANYETDGMNTDCWQHSKTALPEKQWIKLGWFFDGNNDLMKFWLNDQLVDEITVQGQGDGCANNDLKGKWKFPIFENVVIGWVDYQSGGGKKRLWIDDFELSDGIPDEL